MIIYIVYEDSEQYPLSSLLYLYKHMESSGEIFLIEKPKEPYELCSILASLPLKRRVEEWRVLFLDCRQVYACENPYENYEDNFQYIKEFFETCAQYGRKKRGCQIMRTLPEFIYCMVMRCGQYYHIAEEGFLYSDFADRQNNRYRYLLFDVGEKEPELPEQVLFLVLCSVLTLALNELPKAVLDAGFLYQLKPLIDEEKLSKYIGDLERTRRYLATSLYQEKQRRDAEEMIHYVRDISQGDIVPQKGKRTISFLKQRFPFVLEDNSAALAGFRLANIRAIQRLKELSKNPDSCFLNQQSKAEFQYEELLGKRLTEAAMEELAQKKQNCAEELFREPLIDTKLKGLIAESEKRLINIERCIQKRMTRQGFLVLLKKDVAGLSMIAASFGMLIGADALVKNDKIVTWFVAVFYLAIITSGLMVYLAGERKRAHKRLNRSLRRVDSYMKKAEYHYITRIEKASLHRCYSDLLQRQQEFLQADKERHQILEEYEELLLKSEGKIQQFLWLSGKQPEICEEEELQTAIDFSLPPKPMIDAYLPYFKERYELIMEGVGVKLYVPFFFLRDFEIQKLYLPYRESENCAEGIDYEHK